MSDWPMNAHDQDVLSYLWDNVDLLIPWLVSCRAGVQFTKEFLDFHDDAFRAFLEAHREGATA